MTWIEAYKRFWQNAFKMRGRARRKEYWIPVLFNALISIAIGIIFACVDMALGYGSDILADDQMTDVSLTKPSDIANGIWSLILLIPSFTVMARRLQDININGWWALVPHLGGVVTMIGLIIGAFSLFMLGGADVSTLLIMVGIAILVAVIVGIVFLVFTVLDSKPGPNKYGEDPKKNERYYYNDNYQS